MINYKDTLQFPSQIKKFQDFVRQLFSKVDLLEDEEQEEVGSDYIFYEQDSLVTNIITAYNNNDETQLANSVSYLLTHLMRFRQFDSFPLLIQSGIIPVLTHLARCCECCMTTAFKCLFRISFLFQETTPILLDSQFLDVIYFHTTKTPLSKNSVFNIYSLVNILCDCPNLVFDVFSRFPPSTIIGIPPYDQIVDDFRRTNILMFKALTTLFKIYLDTVLPKDEVNCILKYFLFCIQVNNQFDDVNIVNMKYMNDINEIKKNHQILVSGLRGVNYFLMEKNVTESHYSEIANFDFIEISNNFVSDDNDPNINPDINNSALNNIVVCLEIFTQLVKYSLRILNYDFREILDMCRIHFNDVVGVASYELIATILMNCETDTFDTFLLCPSPNFLETVFQGIKNGSFFILYPAAKSAIVVVKGCKEQNSLFVKEEFFEALLRISDVDDSELRFEVIEAIGIIFERCVIENEGSIKKCISAFDCANGVDFLISLSNDEDPRVRKKCSHMLNRFYEMDGNEG